MDNEAQVKITGDSSGAEAAMQKAASAVTSGVGEMKGALGKLSETFEVMQKSLLGLAAIVGGGKFFKEAISESNKMTGETMRLARSMGLTAEQANTLNTALGDIGSDADTYVGAYQRFARQLKQNETAFNGMGIATRDSTGNLLDANTVFTSALGTVGQYKSGLDQTEAAQRLFGKSIDDVMVLQKLNNKVLDEAKEKNQELGLIVTQQNVEASKAYKMAMNDVGDVLTAVMKTIGDGVMPVFTELAEYFASTGPYVVSIFKGAITGLLLVFRTLQAVIKTVTAVIFEAFSHIADQLGNIADLVGAVLKGHWSEAAGLASKIEQRYVQAFVNVKDAAVDAFTTAQSTFANDLDRMYGPKNAANAPASKGSRTMGDLGKSGSTKAESRMGGWESTLKEQEVEFQRTHELREESKQDELKYWQTIAAQAGITAKERIELRQKISTTELEILKEQKQQELQLGAQAIEAEKVSRLSNLEYVRQEAQIKVDTGRMTQLELLQIDQTLEDKRYAIEKEAVEQRLQLLAKDPTKNAVALQKLYDDLDQVEMQHAMKQRAGQAASLKEQTKEWQGFFNSIGNSFGNVVTGIVNHTMTMGQAVKSLFSNLLQSVAGFLGQMVAKKVAAWTTEKALGMASVGMDAAKAGAGAASSQASIPYVGPILALAAMASVFGAVMGLQSSVPSAEGGFDIPGGTNPMTQLHEREMVLPKEHADTIRNMGSQGSGGGNITVNMHPMPGGFFAVHEDDIVKIMKKADRNFRMKK